MSNQPQQPKPQVKTSACPRCGTPMKKAMERHGSVSNPGHNVENCASCNVRKSDNNPS